MSPRLKFIIISSVILILLKLTCQSAYAQQAPATPTSSAGGESLEPNKMFAEINIVTDYMDKGLTYSNHKLAVQAGLGYQWVNFRMGLWGSNVEFPGGSETINARLFLQYKFVWTSNSDMTVKIDKSSYSPDETRSSMISSLTFNLFSHYIIIENDDNFEATEDSATHVAYFKEWSLDTYVAWYIGGGYTSISADGTDNFFNGKTGIKYTYKDITYSLNGSINSVPTQFYSRGGGTVWLGFHARF